MDSKLKKGLLFGLMGVVAESFLPIVTNSRPTVLDPIYFAWFTLIFETLFIFPVMLLEKTISKKNVLSDPVKKGSLVKAISAEEKAILETPETVSTSSPQNLFYPTKFRIFGANILIGIIFSIALIIHYYALQSSGAILGSIVLKSSILYSMLLGWMFLKERVSRSQLIYTVFLLMGVIYSLTEGFTAIVSVNVGGLILLLVPLLWMVGHLFTKFLMRHEIGQPMEIVFWRVFIGAGLVGLFYWIVFPNKEILLFMEWQNLQFLMLGGFVYCCIHVCWYKVIQFIDLSKSTVIYALTPIITSILSTVILKETFSLFYLVGIGMVIFSIIMIYRE